MKPNTDPCFSPEAQETFVAGARIYELGGVPRPIGIFLGWKDGDQHSPKIAVVNWDDFGVRETSFEFIRNVFR